VAGNGALRRICAKPIKNVRPLDGLIYYVAYSNCTAGTLSDFFVLFGGRKMY